jgi:hypothetical protein
MLPIPPFWSLAELGWTVLEVTPEDPQNLVSQGYMTTTELATCHMPEDPTSPVQAGGYVIACATFYDWGFGVPSHRFLRCLL